MSIRKEVRQAMFEEMMRRWPRMTEAQFDKAWKAASQGLSDTVRDYEKLGDRLKALLRKEMRK